MNGGISDMYRLQDFHHPEAPPLESSKPKAFCFQFGGEDDMDPFAILMDESARNQV
jgi:hypothetical protein